jgi:hypothetical protein
VSILERNIGLRRAFEKALASLGQDVFLVAMPASESVAILHTVKRFAAATRPYQRPESFTVRFWLRRST